MLLVGLGYVLIVVLTLAGCSHTQPRAVADQTSTTAQQAPMSINSAESLDRLAGDIVRSMNAERIKQIAVTDFHDLNGTESLFGKFVAEELTTRLFMTKRFSVVERQMLNQILKEQELHDTGLIDPASASRLGKLLGVEAIVTGTVTDLGSTLRVNSRVLSTTSGEVFAVAASTIAKDEGVVALLNAPMGKKPHRSPKGRSLKPSVVYYEDFTATEPGELPIGWTCTDQMMVRQYSGGKHELASFRKRGKSEQLYAASDPIDIPDNCVVELEFWWGEKGSLGVLDISIGDLQIKFSKGNPKQYVYINGSKHAMRVATGISHLLEVHRTKDTYKLLLDKKEIFFGRYVGLELNSIAFRCPIARVGIPLLGIRMIKITRT